MAFHVAGDYAFYFGIDGGINDLAVGGWSMGANSYRVWHAGNDGSGSGLDADTLDGQHLSSVLRSDAADQKTSGTLRFNDNINLTFGSGDDVEFFCNGSHMYTDLNSGIGNWYIRDGSTTRFTFDDAGHFTATGDINSSSDIRLKDNIKTLKGSLENVKKLRGVEYDRTDLRMHGDKRYHQLGVIAQEIEKVYPDIVNEDDDGMKTVSYQQLIPVLIEAVKEQQNQINDLKQEIVKLKEGS